MRLSALGYANCYRLFSGNAISNYIKTMGQVSK
jgi:hypothetical protein